MREVMEMGVGDVITLDKLVDDQLDVYVQGKMKFHGRPGLSGNRVAVQITEMARDLDDETAGIVIELPGEETMSGGQVN
jgi:flagellar motor switch protein FliM